MQAVGTSFVTLGPSVRDTQDRRAVPLPWGGGCPRASQPGVLLHLGDGPVMGGGT